jgi:hypothetical protein
MQHSSPVSFSLSSSQLTFHWRLQMRKHDIFFLALQVFAREARNCLTQSDQTSINKMAPQWFLLPSLVSNYLIVFPHSSFEDQLESPAKFIMYDMDAFLLIFFQNTLCITIKTVVSSISQAGSRVTGRWLARKYIHKFVQFNQLQPTNMMWLAIELGKDHTMAPMSQVKPLPERQLGMAHEFWLRILTLPLAISKIMDNTLNFLMLKFSYLTYLLWVWREFELIYVNHLDFSIWLIIIAF